MGCACWGVFCLLLLCKYACAWRMLRAHTFPMCLPHAIELFNRAGHGLMVRTAGTGCRMGIVHIAQQMCPRARQKLTCCLALSSSRLWSSLTILASAPGAPWNWRSDDISLHLSPVCLSYQQRGRCIQPRRTIVGESAVKPIRREVYNPSPTPRSLHAERRRQPDSCHQRERARMADVGFRVHEVSKAQVQLQLHDVRRVGRKARTC